MRGRVALVGAGPGDPGLITVRGLKLLKEADVVVYDRLVPRELIKEAKPGAELYFVGKKPGGGLVSQEGIEELMIKKAREGRLVVRLKGGDPMLLSRGGEELLALESSGVSVEIVPGVSSALASPSSALFPTTLRGLSSALLVMTGREDPLKPIKTLDGFKLPGANVTIVVLMGLESLESVCKKLLELGLAPETPVCVISNATTNDQRVVDGVLTDISDKVGREGLEPPAVVVVGRVVWVRWWVESIRRGGVVLTLRPWESLGELEYMLMSNGLPHVNIPVVRIQRALKPSDLTRLLSYKPDYVVFTSKVSVVLVEELAREAGLLDEFKKLLNESVLVPIGPGTKRELERRGFGVGLTPRSYSTKGLLDLFLSMESIKSSRLLLFRGEGGDELETRLGQAGADVLRVTTHTLSPARESAWAVNLVERGVVRVLVFTSPSMVRQFDKALGERGLSLASISNGVRMVSIGPVTSRALRDLGVKGFLEAKEHSARGLFNAIREAWGWGSS